MLDFTPTPEDSFEQLKDALEALGCTVTACGSRVTCNPAPTNTDADFLVAIPPYNSGLVSGVVDAIASNGFRFESSQHYQDLAASPSCFMSWRREPFNLIVSANSQFVHRHRIATAICKRLNLLDKAERVAVFQAVLYRNVNVLLNLQARIAVEDAFIEQGRTLVQ